MAAWYLNPALTRFRGEVNTRWPRRDKTSDGTIGDAAHQATSSDHNPDPNGSVDAWDMDVDGVDVQRVIAAALAHESIQYVIYNRKITSRTWGLGTWRPYTGTSPHIEHVHFNTRESHENSTRPWFTGEDSDMATAAEICDEMQERWGLPPQAGFRLTAVYNDVRAVALPALAEIRTNVAALAGADFVDEQAIANAVLAGLGTKSAPEIKAALAAALPEEVYADLFPGG